MSALAATLFSAVVFSSALPLVHAASAAAATARVRILLAFRIGEARARVALGPDQVATLQLQGLELGPALTFPCIVEIAAHRIRGRGDVLARHRDGLIETQTLAIDHQQAFGI